ncbi:NOP58 family protein [Candidatus Woesearchaeota archaeon]|nr:NOP58 family protein [Candidatus Woesearchaeota archaeon]
MAKFYVLNHVTGKFLFDGNLDIVKQINSDSDLPNPADDDVYFLNDYDFAEKNGFKVNFDLTRVGKCLSKLKFNQQEVFNFSVERTKRLIRKSVSKDILIIQAVNSIDELNKSINLLSKRIREWYSLYFPESSEKIEDHEKFIRTISTKSREEQQSFFNIADSMGADLSESDVTAILDLAKSISSLFELKERTTEYVKQEVNKLCPNTSFYIGELIVARMIAVSGGLPKLAGYPASTLQLLGAEKALFRFLKDSKHKSPKYGILYQHSIMSKVKAKERGKVARTLANFMALSLKIDVHNPVLDNSKLEIISKSLRKYLE